VEGCPQISQINADFLINNQITAKTAVSSAISRSSSVGMTKMGKRPFAAVRRIEWGLVWGKRPTKKIPQLLKSIQKDTI